MRKFEKYLKWCVWLLLVLIHFSSSAVLNYYRVNNDPGLYFPEDDVTILTIDNFNNSDTNIYQSNRAWMVEFYSNWCGFCQRAAPRYKAFAADVKGWSDLIVVAALDCANEKNGPVCEHFRITRYPTFRYIHEGYQKDPSNTGLPIIADSHTNYSEHRKNLVDIMRQEQIMGRGKMFPNLQPLNNSDLTKIFNKDAQIGFLIIQDPYDIVGPSITLDFHKVKEVIIRYSYDNETSIKTDSLPALFQVDKFGQLNSLKFTGYDSREEIKRIIRDILLAKDFEVPHEVLRNISVKDIEKQTITVSKETLEKLRKIKLNGDVVYQLDLENALRYSLKREVGGNAEIKGEKLEALRKYIDILLKYFPFNTRGKCLLKQIKQYINSTSTVNGTEIGHWVKEAEETQSIFSGPPQWLGCKGSNPTKRGYPCGLWTLFHYMTVNAAFDPKNTKDSNPRMVLEAMHGYIKNYFGCEDCSEHFQNMSARRELFNVIAWEESVLWLWRAHNEVNKRLSGDTTEDPEFPKVQFPTKDRCPQCWKNNDTADEIEILSYVKQMYAKENINYLDIDNPQISHLNLPNTSDKKSPSRGSTNFGSNLMLALGGFVISVIFMMVG